MGIPIEKTGFEAPKKKKQDTLAAIAGKPPKKPNNSDAQTMIDEDDDNNGDGVSKPLSNPNKEKQGKSDAEQIDLQPVMKAEANYFVNQSTSARLERNVAFPLSYGSADLDGFRYKDTVCLSPMKTNSSDNKELKNHFCVRNFKLQAVMESKGLDGIDGILGLSPRDYGKRSLLSELKRAGHIDRTIVSFSNAFHNASFKAQYYTDNQSYMIFGGYNESQVVNGAKGLFNMPLSGKELNPGHFWGVDGNGFIYGDQLIQDPRTDPPVLSVIDSGTTLVVLPYRVYDGLMMSIAKELKPDKNVSFVCTRDGSS